MRQPICHGCGKEHHVYLSMDNALPEGMLPRELHFCETCGAWLAGIIDASRRRLKGVAVRDDKSQAPAR